MKIDRGYKKIEIARKLTSWQLNSLLSVGSAYIEIQLYLYMRYNSYAFIDGGTVDSRGLLQGRGGRGDTLRQP